MSMALSSESLARACASRPRLTLVLWAAAMAVAVGLWLGLIDSATTEGQGEFSVEPESVAAERVLRESGLRLEGADTELVLIRHDRLTVSDAAFMARIDKVHGEILALEIEGFGRVAADPGSVPNLNRLPAGFGVDLVSSSGRATFMPVGLARGASGSVASVDGLVALAESNSTDGFRVGVVGAAALSRDFREVSRRDLLQGESIGVAAALVILAFVFRTLGAAWIPIALAAVGITLATGIMAVVGQFYDDIPFFVTNFITMIGLAVGIDYALFIVARYREERAGGLGKHEAIGRSGATAGRMVFFSGMTVAIALLGMLLVPMTVFFSMGLGAILVVASTVLASLTLLPALLSLLGDRVESWRLPLPAFSLGGDFWGWVTRGVLRRPLLYLVVAGGALAAVAVPYFGMRLGFNGAETLPDEFQSKESLLFLQREFPEALGVISSVDVVVDGGASSEVVRRGVASVAGFASGHASFVEALPYEVSGDGEVGLLELRLAVSRGTAEAEAAVRELRESVVPGSGLGSGVLVGGATARDVDFLGLVSRWTPIVIGLVLGLSFALLLVVFRSIVAPVKAIILNLLSVGAAYGLLVLVFQKGFMAGVLGFTQVPFIEAWIPLFLFTVLFGLSMDYEVFILSRVRERFDETGDNEGSVEFGVRSTAGIITGAALIMVCVFLGFASGDLALFQQFGFGLAAAIFLDATVVRSALVPASMKLLGTRNWYFPAGVRGFGRRGR